MMTLEQRQRIEQLHQEGASAREIAEQVDMRRMAVHRYLTWLQEAEQE